LAKEILNARELSSIQKAAVMMMNLPEDVIRELLSKMPEDHVWSIGTAIATLPQLSSKVVEEICLEFVSRVFQPSPLKLKGRRFLQNVFPRVADPQVARDIVREIDGMELRNLRDWLNGTDPTTLASVLRREHPQTIGVVCALAQPNVSARVIEELPEDLGQEVLVRQAMLEELPAEMLAEIEEVLLSQTSRVSEFKMDLEGVECAAAVLKNFKPEQREELLQQIRNQSPELSEQIMRSMFSFDTMATADDRGIQALMREIDRKDLTIALKGSPESVQNKFFDNMSERAAQFLQEDLEVTGPLRMEDVEEAQRRIMSQALVLESEGKLLFIDDSGSDMVL